MTDQIIMNTTLTLTKNLCGMLMHGSIESQEGKVNKTFCESLEKYLTLQKGIFTEMQNQGFYETENVPESKITKVKNKHTSSSEE